MFLFFFEGYLTRYAIDSPAYLGWRQLQVELKRGNPKMNLGFMFKFAEVNCPINLSLLLWGINIKISIHWPNNTYQYPIFLIIIIGPNQSHHQKMSVRKVP